MSRNLNRTTCVYCGSRVSLTSKPRPITERYARAYYSEFEGMIVAKAECRACEAKYLAWVEWQSPDRHFQPHDCGFFDLSFRYSFNDEPDKRDLPRFELEMKAIRMRPSNRPELKRVRTRPFNPASTCMPLGV